MNKNIDMNEIKNLIQMSNLLRSLRPEDIELLIPYMEVISLTDGEVIYEQGDVVQQAYFPCGATMISFIVMLKEGRGVETALIGREGAVGGIVSHGHLPAFCRAVVQYGGEALRISTINLEKAKAASPALYHFFARYADCLMAQIFQAVACNATHTIEQRASKWLVGAVERTQVKTVPLTQEQLASMLGVGRSYVVRVISNLKNAGVLQSLRGQLVIHKLEELKNFSCNCDDLVRRHFDEVLAHIYPGSEK